MPNRFGDTVEEQPTSRFGDTVEPETVQTTDQPAHVPFGVVPPGAAPVGPTLATAEDIGKLADPFLQGLTFGFGDEATAAALALTSDETFGDALARVRGRSEAIRAEIGDGPFMATELAGGLTTSARLGPAALAAPIIRNLPTLARFGLTGAGAGAVAGAGTTEGGVEERAVGAAEGAAFGATIGVVLPVAFRAAAAALQPVIARLEGPRRAAVERIRAALGRDAMTPEQAMQRLRELGIEATLADAGGENVRGLARAVQSVPGRGRDLGRQVFEQRQAGQTARLADTVNKNLRADEGFRQTLDDLASTRRTNAVPLYEAAYAAEVPFTVELQALFNRPAIKQAWERAQTIAANEGVTLPQVFTRNAAGELTLNTQTAPTMQAIDFIKRGLDDIVERSRNALTGAIEGDVARGVASSRRDLLETVDDLNPAYKNARAVYAGDSASIDALRQGRLLGLSLTRRGTEALDPEQIFQNLSRMAEGEKAFFRQGLARGLIDVIESTPDRADAVKRLIGTEARRGRLRAAFPDGETFDRFMFDLSREARMFETGAEVLGNSVTARLQADQAALISDDALAGLLQGRPGTAATSGLAGLIGRLRRPSPKVADELANILFAQGRVGEQALTSIINTPTIPPALQRAAQAALLETERQAGTNR